MPVLHWHSKGKVLAFASCHSDYCIVIMCLSIFCFAGISLVLSYCDFIGSEQYFLPKKLSICLVLTLNSKNYVSEQVVKEKDLNWLPSSDDFTTSRFIHSNREKDKKKTSDKEIISPHLFFA